MLILRAVNFSLPGLRGVPTFSPSHAKPSQTSFGIALFFVRTSIPTVITFAARACIQCYLLYC